MRDRSNQGGGGGARVARKSEGEGARERGEGTLAPDHARLAPITDFSVSVCPTLGTCSPG